MANLEKIIAVRNKHETMSIDINIFHQIPPGHRLISNIIRELNTLNLLECSLYCITSRLFPKLSAYGSQKINTSSELTGLRELRLLRSYNGKYFYRFCVNIKKKYLRLAYMWVASKRLVALSIAIIVSGFVKLFTPGFY